MTADFVLPVQLLVLAKLPRPGRVKTRLSPPYTQPQAAELAAAALRDTLEAVAATRCTRCVLAFDGPPGAWLPAGFTLIRQRGNGLAERLGNAFADAYAKHPVPVLLVGMDTPQLDTSILEQAAQSLVAGPHDAVLGPATDGGFWTIGLTRPHPETFSNVGMSTESTCREQHQQLTRLGFRVDTLPALTDVDDEKTADAVAAEAPRSWFAAQLAAIRQEAARQEVG